METTFHVNVYKFYKPNQENQEITNTGWRINSYKI